MNRNLFTVLGLSLALAVAVGCGGAQQAKTGKGFAATMKGAPDWAMKGCAAFSGEKKTWICGVGSMGGTNNLSMCRDMATARGRQQIAQTLNLGFAGLVQDYQKTLTGGSAYGKAADDEQLSMMVSEQVTKVSLPGTRVEDMWFSDEGHCFSLVVLDFKTLQSALDGVTGVDQQIKDYVTRNAEKAFQLLQERTGNTPPAAE